MFYFVIFQSRIYDFKKLQEEMSNLLVGNSKSAAQTRNLLRNMLKAEVNFRPQLSLGQKNDISMRKRGKSNLIREFCITIIADSRKLVNLES